jgi:hypothetical protein
MSWAQLESLTVELGYRAQAEVLALMLDDAQERPVEQGCGLRRAPRARDGGGGEPTPFACPGSTRTFAQVSPDATVLAPGVPRRVGDLARRVAVSASTTSERHEPLLGRTQ